MSYSNLQTVKPQIDFAILTALPVERKAVCKALRISDDMRVSKEGPAYWRGKLKLDDGSFYEIVVGQCAYPGNVEAAAMAVDALKTWNPQAALFIGVAGATNGTLKLGDIVPAGQIIYYELGKTTPEGMEPETRQYTADATLWQAVQTGVDWTEPILAERPDGTETRPAVVPGAIASGEKVIADAEYRDKICKRDRKINAIEMEGYGFSHAAWQQCSHVRALVIRSIVDFADGDKNSDWQQYAAAAAASYCANFLKGRPIPPRNIPGPANDKVRDDPALEGMLPIYVGDRPTSMLAVADDELLADIPGLPDPLVDSSAIVKHIHDKFGPNNKYIAVEGTFQTGKTVLLTQFAWAYRDRTFSVFTGTNLINSNLRSVLLTLCTQMQVYLVRQLPGLEALDTDKLLQAFHRLYKLVREKASKCKIPTFFIIDGVEWISRGQSGSSILQLLPAIPSNSTYLLVSARPDTELTGCITRVDVLPYSKADIREYLREYSICDDDLEKIFRLSGGLPGYLSLVRTRLEAGITPQNVVGDLAPDLHGMLEQEWTRSGIDGADAQLSMSIVAFAKSTIKARDLKTISANSRGKCSPTLDGNPFLRTHGPDGEISYISETHKQFVMTRMYAKRETAERLLIDYYSADPYNPVSMVSLESFLDTPQRYPKLKELVTAQYLQRRLMYTRSISAVRGNLAKLTKLASSKRDWQALPKYALASSMLTEILDRPVAQEEVEALVGLKKYSLALETAYQAILPEDQLQLLSYVYSRMRTDGYAITDTTIADLDAKALEISGEGLGSRAIEVAASLFDVRPQAALSLLERSTAGRAGDKAIDLARALLAIRLEFEEEHNDLHRTTEVISSSITDKTLRDFVKTVSPRLQQLTAAQLLGEIDNITNTSWRMFAFIAWCNANQEAADSGTIIERALDTITHDESYGVSMRQLRQLAEPLTHLNADVSQPLLERIDLIKNKALKRPIDELVRLEAVLASVEAPGDPEQAENRLLAAYFDLYKIDEIDGRCACLAQLLDALHIVKISRYEETRTEIETQLDSTFSQLLTTSADHQRTTRSLLKLLARVDPERALRYAKMLNLEDRRQTAYTDILLSHIDHAKGNLDTKVVDTILASFSMPQRYGVALASLLSRMAANNLLSERPDLEKYIDNIKSISFVEEACYACAHAICSLSAVNGTTKTEAIYTHLCVLLDQIDTDWGRARIRLRVASILARARPDLAGKFVDEATSLRSVTPLATDTFAPVYFNGVRLAIEALPDRIGKGRMQLDSYSSIGQRPMCSLCGSGYEAVF
jgi:nucleoside phosphorylase